MTESTVAQRAAHGSPDAHVGHAAETVSGTAAGAVALALLDIVDAELADGPGRGHVLAAALELAVLQPELADLVDARAEVEADHVATLRALTEVPIQRSADDIRTPLVAAADTLRDRRLEALDLALGLVAPTR